MSLSFEIIFPCLVCQGFCSRNTTWTENHRKLLWKDFGFIFRCHLICPFSLLPAVGGVWCRICSKILQHSGFQRLHWFTHFTLRKTSWYSNCSFQIKLMIPCGRSGEHICPFLFLWLLLVLSKLPWAFHFPALPLKVRRARFCNFFKMQQWKSH